MLDPDDNVVDERLRVFAGGQGVLLDLLPVFVGAREEIGIEASKPFVAGPHVAQRRAVGVADMEFGAWVIDGRGDVELVFHNNPIINEKPPLDGGIFVSCGLLLVLVKTVFLVEPIDPAVRLGKPLFTGKERVAVAAGVDADFLAGRSRLERGAAGNAGDGYLLVLGMDACFHTCVSFRLKLRASLK